MKLTTENITLETEERSEKWANIDLEAACLYWKDVESKTKSRREKSFVKARVKETLDENLRLFRRQRFEQCLQTHKIDYKTGDEKAAKDFDQAIWEYRLWGRIPLWLKTVISCSAVGIFYSVAIGSRHSSTLRYHPISRWHHPIPGEALKVLETIQDLPETERLGIFGIVRKETDPILAVKVADQWYNIFEWE
jgi:hypothetical protein